MKIKIISYCQEIIDGRLLILDANKIYDLNDNDAINLIDMNLAEEICEQSCSHKEQDVLCENKMISLTKNKKRKKEREEGL